MHLDHNMKIYGLILWHVPVGQRSLGTFSENGNSGRCHFSCFFQSSSWMPVPTFSTYTQRNIFQAKEQDEISENIKAERYGDKQSISQSSQSSGHKEAH